MQSLNEAEELIFFLDVVTYVCMQKNKFKIHSSTKMRMSTKSIRAEYAAGANLFYSTTDYSWKREREREITHLPIVIASHWN